MDRLADKATRIAETRDEAIRRYPALWQRMIAEWHQPGAEPRTWLMYSANYLFRTSNVWWAIDPVRLQHRLPAAPSCDFAEDLSKLSFVLLTHKHSDHLDLKLIRTLRKLAITWVVPQPILERVREKGGISSEQIIVPEPTQPINLDRIQITPFEGMHWGEVLDAVSGRRRGVPAMGYLVEVDGKRWLFPGDTRTYDASLIPNFGAVDALFAHVWLGRGSALQPERSLLNEFCRFCLDLQPSRVVLTHLQEFGRAPDDYWDQEHAELAVSKIRELRPALPVVSASMGDSISL